MATEQSLLKQANLKNALKFFRQRRSAALQKKLFATRHSLFAVVLGSAGTSPSQTRYSLLTTRHSQFNVCHSPAAQFDFELEALVTSQGFNFHFSAARLLENQTL
ncbi:MAG: hypothetical protein LASZOEIN_000267 [Candidatus Fervidibacter sp.]